MQKNNPNDPTPIPKERRKKWLKRVLVIGSVLSIALFLYAIIFVWSALSGGHNDLGKSNLRDSQVNLNKDPFAILLIGSDARKEGSQNWRPDVIMVAAINPKKKSMTLVSIPRDTWVEIANTNGGKDKINHAPHYAYVNGIDPIKNTRETVENFLNIPIDHYSKVNFKGFMDVVDLLGGIDVNVKQSFTIDSFGGKKLYFREGPMHLNGEYALAYARMRKQDPLGDKGRNIRQQEILGEILSKMVSLKGLSQFNELTKRVGENVSYSIRPTEIPSLLAIYREIPKQNIETIFIETTFKRRDGKTVEIVSEEEQQRISKLLQEQLEWKPKHQPNEQPPNNEVERKLTRLRR